MERESQRNESLRALGGGVGTWAVIWAQFRLPMCSASMALGVLLCLAPGPTREPSGCYTPAHTSSTLQKQAPAQGQPSGTRVQAPDWVAVPSHSAPPPLACLACRLLTRTRKANFCQGSASKGHVTTQKPQALGSPCDFLPLRGRAQGLVHEASAPG